MQRRLAIAGSLVTLALVLGFALYYSGAGKADTEALACDIDKQLCSFSTPYGEADFRLTPTPPSSKAPIRFTLSIEGKQPDRVWVDLQGKEMYMGVNQTNLNFDAGIWSAPGTLGVCTTGTMRWVLSLILERGEQQQVYTFEFDAS